MFDMMKMMGKMKEVQAKMKEAQEKVGEITAEGESGGGMVKVKVNGLRQVLSMEIDDDLIKPEDKQMLSDLIIAATNKALEEVEGLAKEEMQKATEGMLPNIPGMDMSSLFNG